MFWQASLRLKPVHILYYPVVQGNTGCVQASLRPDVTKFFRASRPVHRASLHQDSRPVWKFYSAAILKFQITFEFRWDKKNIQNSNNIKKNAKQNYGYFKLQTYWRKGRAFKYYSKFIANFTNHTLGILKPKYCSLGVEGKPLLAVDFSIFQGHSGQQAGHRRTVAAAKFEAWNLVFAAKASYCEVQYAWHSTWYSSWHSICCKFTHFNHSEFKI